MVQIVLTRMALALRVQTTGPKARARMKSFKTVVAEEPRRSASANPPLSSARDSGSVVECDLLVIGSGAGSIPASLVARDLGASVIVVEKSQYLGGSTAMSGGVVWAPMNPLMARAGKPDEVALATAYVDACAGAPAPSSTPEKRQNFIRNAGTCISLLEAHGVRFVYADGYADYHEGEKPGGLTRGRSLSADLFDLRKLGDWYPRLRPSGMPPFPIVGLEGAALLRSVRTFSEFALRWKLAWRLVRNLLGARIVAFGSALYGAMLAAAVRSKVTFWLNSPIERLTVEQGAVVGAEIRHEGALVRVRARKGVLLNAGGFARNQAMREKFQAAPASTKWTIANPGDTGEVLEMAQAIGAATDMLDNSWWVPSVILPDGTPEIVAVDMQKPHLIVVDGEGSRFVNEATSYHTVGLTMYRRHASTPTVPAWLIFDSDFARRYRLAGRSLRRMPKGWVESGFVKTAPTIETLAAACNLPAVRLRATIERFNGFAGAGEDLDFGRGKSRYNHVYADPSNEPSACLGPIAAAPFFAVRLYPGDIGTAGGLVTDAHARVLDKNGKVITGLYATGNITAGVMGRSYPGAGGTLGPAMTFGFIAARHALGVESCAPLTGRNLVDQPALPS